MSRPGITQWCDFVRGVADPDAEREMRQRLDAGDAGARRIVDAFARVQQVARADDEAAVPEYALRMVKAIGSLQRPKAEVPRTSAWRFLPVEINFDSLLQPTLAGMRDMQSSYRQMSFKAEAYTVDVRLDPGKEQQKTDVVGQVLQRSGESPEATRPVVEVPVLAVASDAIVDRSVTSRFGEFHVVAPASADLALYVLVGDEDCIAVRLDPENV